MLTLTASSMDLHRRRQLLVVDRYLAGRIEYPNIAAIAARAAELPAFQATVPQI